MNKIFSSKSPKAKTITFQGLGKEKLVVEKNWGTSLVAQRLTTLRFEGKRGRGGGGEMRILHPMHVLLSRKTGHFAPLCRASLCLWIRGLAALRQETKYISLSLPPPPLWAEIHFKRYDLKNGTKEIDSSSSPTLPYYKKCYCKQDFFQCGTTHLHRVLAIHGVHLKMRQVFPDARIGVRRGLV